MPEARSKHGYEMVTAGDVIAMRTSEWKRPDSDYNGAYNNHYSRHEGLKENFKRCINYPIEKTCYFSVSSIPCTAVVRMTPGGPSAIHISTPWGADVYENGTDITDATYNGLDALACLYNSVPREKSYGTVNEE